MLTEKQIRDRIKQLEKLKIAFPSMVKVWDLQITVLKEILEEKP